MYIFMYVFISLYVFMCALMYIVSMYVRVCVYMLQEVTQYMRGSLCSLMCSKKFLNSTKVNFDFQHSLNLLHLYI